MKLNSSEKKSFLALTLFLAVGILLLSILFFEGKKLATEERKKMLLSFFSAIDSSDENFKNESKIIGTTLNAKGYAYFNEFFEPITYDVSISTKYITYTAIQLKKQNLFKKNKPLTIIPLKKIEIYCAKLDYPFIRYGVYFFDTDETNKATKNFLFTLILAILVFILYSFIYGSILLKINIQSKNSVIMRSDEEHATLNQEALVSASPTGQLVDKKESSATEKQIKSIRNCMLLLTNNEVPNFETIEEATSYLSSVCRNTEKELHGAYYITNLLTKPYHNNGLTNSLVKVTFYMEQEKRFVFKNKEDMIGGDFCFAQTIQIKQKDYTLFANWDAMGKSFQGALGSLMCASFLNQSISSQSGVQNKTPSSFLTQIYTDLQKSFLIFDGAMYCSAFFGLIDNLSGKLYYFNAEHPPTLLYRKGEASYIETETHLHKLGKIADDKIEIKTFALKAGDILITGSDGREGLCSAKSEIGINETERPSTEKELLTKIELCDGDITALALELKKNEIIRDDFSLLSVRYKPLEQG